MIEYSVFVNIYGFAQDVVYTNEEGENHWQIMEQLIAHKFGWTEQERF